MTMGDLLLIKIQTQVTLPLPCACIASKHTATVHTVHTATVHTVHTVHQRCNLKNIFPICFCLQYSKKLSGLKKLVLCKSFYIFVCVFLNMINIFIFSSSGSEINDLNLTTVLKINLAYVFFLNSIENLFTLFFEFLTHFFVFYLNYF